MGFKDDYLYRLKADYAIKSTTMSSGERYAAENTIKGLEAQNQAAQNRLIQLQVGLDRNITSMTTGEIYAAQNKINGLKAQNPELEPVVTQKELRDKVILMLASGECYEAIKEHLRNEVPDAALAAYPGLIEDVTNDVKDDLSQLTWQEAEELMSQARTQYGLEFTNYVGLDEREMIEPGDTNSVYENYDGRGASTLDDYRFMDLAEQRHELERAIEDVVIARFNAGLGVGDDLGIYIPQYILDSNPNFVQDTIDRIVNGENLGADAYKDANYDRVTRVYEPTYGASTMDNYNYLDRMKKNQEKMKELEKEKELKQRGKGVSTIVEYDYLVKLRDDKARREGGYSTLLEYDNFLNNEERRIKKEIRDEFYLLYAQGEFYEDIVEILMEIPEAVLMDNPNIITDVFEDVKGELSEMTGKELSSFMHELNIEISQGLTTYEGLDEDEMFKPEDTVDGYDGRGASTSGEYKYMKLSEQRADLEQALEEVIRGRLNLGLTVYPAELGIDIPEYIKDSDPDFVKDITDRVVDEMTEEHTAQIKEEQANRVRNAKIKADDDPTTVSAEEIAQNYEVIADLLEQRLGDPEGLYAVVSLLGDSGVYYFDATAGAGKVIGGQGGYTIVVNLDEDFAASYGHIGAYASLSPADIMLVSGGGQFSSGQILSGLEKAEDYTGLSLQGSATVLSFGVDGAVGVDFDGDISNNTVQRGTHVSVSSDDALVSVSGSADWYFLVQSHDMSDWDISELY